LASERRLFDEVQMILFNEVAIQMM